MKSEATNHISRRYFQINLHHLTVNQLCLLVEQPKPCQILFVLHSAGCQGRLDLVGCFTALTVELLASIEMHLPLQQASSQMQCLVCTSE